MRFSLVALLLAALASPLSAADVQIARVWPGYRTAESFERISEYFTGRENSGRDIILRTQPSAREGFYFLTRLANRAAAIEGATFELSVISPTSALPRTHRFVANIPAGSRAFQLGLTGNDWPDPQAEPVAWQVIVWGPDGTELARKHSFLWSKPETKSSPH